MQALVNVFSLKIYIIIILSFLVACGGSESTNSNSPIPDEPDTIAPVITLNGEANVTLFLNDSYTEQGATAVDDRDGTVEVVITGTVDTSTLGTYTISYSASDNAGNSSSIDRTVNVVLPPDTIAPVITLNGGATVTLFLNDSYTEQGATAVDDRDSSVEVVITGSVDTSTFGNYTITYSATDNAGNTSSVERTVNVVLPPDTTAPVITLNGEPSLSLVINTAYTEQGATAVDDRDGSVEVVITGSVDTSTLGTYTITYSATDNAGNTSSVERSITVIPVGAFITTWQTDNQFALSNDNQIKITTFGSGYNYRVDWGDGSYDEGVNGDITHTYASPGRYTVIISGDFPQLYYPPSTENDDGEEVLHSDATKLTSVEQWGNNVWRSMHRAFADCSNLVINAQDTPDLSQVSDMSYMFNYAKRFNQDISRWDVSNVTNMSYMFSSAINFNQDISDWNVSNVADMSRMFSAAYPLRSKFNQEINNWDVSNVTDMTRMFYRSDFNQDIGNWDVSNITDMRGMFSGATVFNQDIGSWDVSNVTDMRYMFYDVYDFNQDIGNWDVSNVTDMRGMFSYAEYFNQDIGSWDVSNVTDMRDMFYDVYDFNQDISNWDVSNVNDMGGMFARTRVFNQDISNWDVSNVNDMGGMFSSTNDFNQDIGSWDVSNVSNMSYMFSSARVFNQDIGSWDVGQVVNLYWMFSNANDFNQDIGNWDVSNVTDMSYMFYEAFVFDQDIGSWDVSNVSDMSGMFSNANDFNQDIGSWDVSNVTRMDYMFYEAFVFDQDIGSWDVSNVSDMRGMFRYAEYFNHDIGNWNVSNVTNMNRMFSSTNDFNQDIGSWDVSNVSNMSYMFSSARVFNQDIGSWDVGQVVNLYWMFRNAHSFNQDIGGWDVSNVEYMNSMFEGVSLSTQNYDALLIGWSSLTLQSGVFFDGGGSQYSSGAQSARNILTDVYNWTISDGGMTD